jgi:hypothetical protein
VGLGIERFLLRMAAVQIERDHLPGPPENRLARHSSAGPLGEKRRQRQTASEEAANPQHLAARDLPSEM